MALAGRLAGRGAVEVSAEGCRVELSDGRTALDFGSYAVGLLGHRHPDVVAAVHRQLDVMTTATRVLVNPVTAAAAARLADYLGGALSRVYFGLNGTDAVEAAVKLARLASGRQRVVAVVGGFHGKSLGSLALTHYPPLRAGLEPVLAEATHVAAHDPETVSREVARGDVAALVFEPVQGESGVRPLDTGLLRGWCAEAARHDTFVIADEIQTGLRRCGERSLALAAGLDVDAVLVGKPLGGGVLPLSAAVCSERLFAPLIADPLKHTATFSGHPLSCAALPAALDAIEALADRGRVIAAAVETGLARLRSNHPDVITDVRGRGLLWGLNLASPQLASRLAVDLSRDGLLVSPCLGRPDTVRLIPPLVAEDADVEEAIAILEKTIGRSRTGAAKGGTA
jgi:putrescine aminotransferase